MPRPRFATLDPARRAAILAAAAEELAQHGLEGASYNRIITRAGASKGAMYYYFDDKQDLLRAVLDDALARSSAAITSSGAPGPCRDAAEFWAEIHRLCAASLELLARDPVLAGLAVRMLGASTGPLAEAIATITERLSSFTAALLRQGQAVGAVRDDLPIALLTHLLTGVGEAMDRWLLPRFAQLGAHERAALPAQMVDLFARLAAPAPPPASQGKPRRKR